MFNNDNPDLVKAYRCLYVVMVVSVIEPVVVEANNLYKYYHVNLDDNLLGY